MKHYEDFYNEAQQYSTILKRYEENKEVFTDPNFIPNCNIQEPLVEFNNEKHVWHRIDKYYKSPLFKSEAISEDAIQQGELGTCYFIASLTRIAKQPELVELLFDTRTRKSSENENSIYVDTINLKCGAVVVYFHVFGKRTPVLIDTLIPFERGTRKPRFSHPSDIMFSPWFCLVEKAYAKLNGSYSAIISGKLSQAIYHLFGYYPCYNDIDGILEKRKQKLQLKGKTGTEENFDENEYLFSLLMKWQYQDAVLGADITIDKLRKGVTEENIKDNGLVPAHAYLILKVRREEGKNFICLRNPWGEHEWLGDWSDTSKLWTNKLKRALGVHFKNNGTFWMIDKDFFRYFSSFDVAKPINPEYHNKTVMTTLEPGETDGFQCDSEEAHLEKHQTFAFKLKNVRVKNAEGGQNFGPDVQEVDDVKVYITVEKRSSFIKTDSESSPKYQMFIVYSNGKKVEFNQLQYYNRHWVQTVNRFFRFSIHIKENDPFVIIFQRNDKKDFKEECYASFSCKYDFDLYDVDHPDKLASENVNLGVLFDNKSRRYSNIARKIITKNINGKNTRTFENSDLSEKDENFYKHLNMNPDSHTSSRYFEYDISDMNGKKTLNSEDISQLLDETKRQFQNELTNILDDTKKQTLEAKNEITSLLEDTKKQTQEAKEEISNLLNDTKRQTQQSRNELSSFLNDTKNQVQNSRDEQLLKSSNDKNFNDNDDNQSTVSNNINNLLQDQGNNYNDNEDNQSTISNNVVNNDQTPANKNDTQTLLDNNFNNLLHESSNDYNSSQTNNADDQISSTANQNDDLPAITNDISNLLAGGNSDQKQQQPQEPQEQPQQPQEQQPLQPSQPPQQPVKEIKEPEIPKVSTRHQPKNQLETFMKGAEKNDPAHLFNLGLMYSKGQGAPVDKAKAAEYYERSAALDNPKAQYNLALMYLNGDGIPKDRQKAVDLLEQAASNGHKFAQSKLGNMYSMGDCVDQNFAKAVDFYTRAAEQNEPEAQVNLGYMYDQGEGVDVDKAKAFDMYSRSAENGNSKALFNLAYMYENGVNGLIQKDIKKSAELYQKAADKGVTQALFNLGQLYSKGGNNFPVNKIKAAQLFEQGANSGDPNAMVNLASMYYSGEGVPNVDKNKAAELYKKAAKLNHRNAQFNLGLLYSKGEGVEKNPKKAAKYYEKAANQNVSKAKFNLGVLLFQGAEGVPQDKARAAQLFESVSHRNHKALFNLAVMFENGDGVEKDTQKALAYYNRAAEMKDKDALLNLGCMYDDGFGGVEKDKKKAFDYYQKAAALGSDKAQTNLGLMYLKGEACPVDKEKAKEYFRAAAEKGNPQAQLNLGILLEEGDRSDRSKASDYLRQAADEGNSEAMLLLARKAMQNNDLNNAIKYYEIASNAGNHQAKLELARIYLNENNGVQNDVSKAEKLLLEAADQDDDKDALECLYDLYKKQGQEEKANAYYQRAFGTTDNNNNNNNNNSNNNFNNSSNNNNNNVYNNNSNYQNSNNNILNSYINDILDNSNNSKNSNNTNNNNNNNALDNYLNNIFDNNNNANTNNNNTSNNKANMTVNKSIFDSVSEDMNLVEEEEMISDSQPKTLPAEPPISYLYKSLLNKIQCLNGSVSSGKFTNVQSTLDDVHGVLVHKGLNDRIALFNEQNKSLQSIEKESASLLSKLKVNTTPTKSSLPSLNPDKLASNDDTILSLSESSEPDEELDDLKLEVEILESKIGQLERQILKATGSSSPRVQSPQDMTTEEILKKYVIHPRTKRSKLSNLKKKADDGDANSQYLLGACYATGQGVAQDKEKALEYYIKSAKNGDSNGQYSAANCYYYGKGTPVNQKEAMRLFLLASAQGHSKAQFALGHIYEFGKCGKRQDFDKAVEYYKLAAKNGHEAAIKRLKSDSFENI